MALCSFVLGSIGWECARTVIYLLLGPWRCSINVYKYHVAVANVVFGTDFFHAVACTSHPLRFVHDFDRLVAR